MSRRSAIALVVVGLMFVPVASACGTTGTTRSSTDAQGRTGQVGSRSSTSTSTALTPASGSGTTQIRFDPYGGGHILLPDLQVTQTVSGSCVAPGVAGSTSYRCISQPGSLVYDPCFSPQHATGGPLACVADPGVSDVVEFEGGALPAATGSGTSRHPWAIKLSNGQVCVLVAAAWGAGIGPFACPTPAERDSVADCHPPAQAPLWWSAACQAAQTASSPFGDFRVLTVWE